MKLEDRRVLVTGGCGFIGSFLAEQLVERGCRVRVLAHYRAERSEGNLALVDPAVRRRIDVVWGDVTDRDSVQNSMEGMSVVFHLAALIGIPYSYVAPACYVSTNTVGTLNVLQAARNCAVERVVHTSTSETYGSARYTPMDEGHPLVAQSPYSASKIAADKLAESFWRSFDLPVVTVRPFNAFGPRQTDRAVIPTIIAQRLAGREEIRLGDATTVRDFTFVTDTARAFVLAAECDQAVGRTINVGSGVGRSIARVAEAVFELTGGGRLATTSERTRPANSEVRELVCDAALARQLLGWQPDVSFTEGLKRTLAFVAENPARYDPHEYVV
jgi:NAD dependent epimerase/dehydratase